MKTQRGGLSEFVSRNGRVKLIKLLLTNGWSVSGLAAALGISVRLSTSGLSGKKRTPATQTWTSSSISH